MSGSSFQPLSLTGKIILVTGASSGLGRATGAFLARLGARVILTARHSGTLDAAAAGFPGDGHVVAPFDLLETDGIPAFVQSLASAHGPLSGVVHAAGVMPFRPLRQVEGRDWEAAFRLNVFAAGALAKGFRAPGANIGGGSVVFLSSVAGISGAPAQSVYGSSKGALDALVRSLAVELGREGIRVNAVAPGVVDAGMTDAIRARTAPERFAALVADHPLGLGSADDVAGAVAFLLADTGKWITGTTLVVDGGYTAG